MAQMRLLMAEHVPSYLATGPDLVWDNMEYQGDDITLAVCSTAVYCRLIILQTWYCGKNDIHLRSKYCLRAWISPSCRPVLPRHEFD